MEFNMYETLETALPELFKYAEIATLLGSFNLGLNFLILLLVMPLLLTRRK